MEAENMRRGDKMLMITVNGWFSIYLCGWESVKRQRKGQRILNPYRKDDQIGPQICTLTPVSSPQYLLCLNEDIFGLSEPYLRHII